jgi:hypothetical protein
MQARPSLATTDNSFRLPLVLLVLALAVIAFPAASAGAGAVQQEGSGTGKILGGKTIVTYKRGADTVTLGTIQLALTGTLAGNTVAVWREVDHPDGSFTFSDTEAFTGTLGACGVVKNMPATSSLAGEHTDWSGRASSFGGVDGPKWTSRSHGGTTRFAYTISYAC